MSSSNFERFASATEPSPKLNRFVNENGKFLLINDRGEKICDKEFDQISYFSEGTSAVRDTSGHYHIDRMGNALYQERYDDITPFNIGQARVHKDGYSFVIDRKGELIETGPYFV